ncbi:MAG: cache domain-containing protein, partial [Prochloraceae cyanobacterium]
MEKQNILKTIYNFFTGRSLFTIMITPSLIQIVVVAVFTGYLAFNNSNKSINKLAFRLCDEISEHLSQQLLNYLNKSEAIQKIFFAELKKSNLSLDDLKELETFFLTQIQGYDSINKVYFSSSKKNHFIGIIKESENYQLWITDLSSKLPVRRKFYSLDSKGNRIKLLKLQNYDPHSRPWYQLAVSSSKPIFSDIYDFLAISSSGDFVSGITKSVPVLDDNERLQGVLAFDITLSQINNFMRKSNISQNGVVFILDEKGRLVSSSIEKEFSNWKDKQNEIIEQENSLISQAIKYLSKNYPDIAKIDDISTTFQFKDGSKNFLHVKALKYNYGLNWQIVVVVPRSDFAAQIDANTINTIWLCLWLLFLAIIVGILIAQRTIKPILKLNEYAKNLTKDINNAKWNNEKINMNRLDEVGELFRSFNQMAQQLKDLIFSLEERVKERSHQLQKAQEAKVITAKQSEKRLANFLEAVPIGIFVIDKEGQPYYANRASDFILGKGLVKVAPEKLIETYRLYKAGTNKPYPNDLNPILIALKERQSLTIEDMEVRNGNKKTLLQVFANPILDKDKKIEYAIVVFFDITERKQIETERLNFTRQLEIKNIQLEEQVEKIERLSLKNALQDALLRDVTREPDSFEYQLGGTLQVDAPTYVVREADVILYRSLINGEFCYIFNARQMGKSSMQVKIAAQLKSEGYNCISLDLSEFVNERISTATFYSC